MLENYQHFITKNIKAYYGKRIWAPILFLLLLVMLWIFFSMGDIRKPIKLPADADVDYFYKTEAHYVIGDFTDLTFSGYICEENGRTQGYYYYTSWNDASLIVLLSPSTCEQGLPHIPSLHVNGKLMAGQKSYDDLLTRLADDLSWTKDGITSQMPDTYFSEPANHLFFTSLMFALYYISMLAAAINIALYLVHIIFPATAPAVQNLIVFGHPRKMLEEAEEELATLPQLATEDMFITEHYFIMTSPDANAIVPIDQILWIYKHSTLHKFLWYHFSISYTMHITARKHLYIHCPKNIKSDIDGIMDYLAEANHDIVVGFSEENRIKVQAEMGKPFHVEKVFAFLRKKI